MGVICFAVPDGRGQDREFPIRHACLLGEDDVPVLGEIRHSDGLIRCEKRTSDSCALSVQFPVLSASGGMPAGGGEEPSSLITLQTCLLPERSHPYLLSLELARHRIMLILIKIEEWALFDLDPASAPMLALAQALQAFTVAVTAASTHGPGPAVADRAARVALARALEAGEVLVMHQARTQYERRASGELAAAAAAIQVPSNAITEHEAAASRNALLGTAGVILPSPVQVGVRVAPDQFSPNLQKAVQQCADFANIPMRWIDLEPTEGKYDFAKTDRWIEWAVRQAKLPLVGGPVIDFRPRSVPEWLYIWEHDYDTLRELVFEHLKNVVTRYRRTIPTWTVASGLNINANFSFSFEQVLDMTRLGVMVVRKLHPSAKVQIEIDLPWGDYHTDRPRSSPPIVYAEMLAQAGVHVDQFCVRVDMGQPEIGRSARDPLAFSAMLDRFAGLEKPIVISAIGAPSQPPDDESLGLNRQLDPGWWKTPWSAAHQADYLSTFLSIAAAKPFVQSICWAEMYDSDRAPENRHDGLISSRGEPRPAYQRLVDFRAALAAKRFPAVSP